MSQLKSSTTNLNFVESSDPEIAKLLYSEQKRQQSTLELIASENFTSLAIMQAQGSCLTNKYAEGLPNKRYYGGCEVVDEVEQIAIDRAKELFGAEHANVQPHSGASANNAVFFALLTPGDHIMGMDLSNGGHLTHGSPVNISGKHYKVTAYGVDPKTGLLDYDEVERLALENKPKMIIAGASAYARKIDFKRFSEIARKIDAILFVDMAHIAGLVAAGLHQNPVEYADVVTTTTHKTLRGPRGGIILCKEKYAKAIDKSVFPGTQGGPLMHVVAGKAICFREALSDEFRSYQLQVSKNAKEMGRVLMENGFDIVSSGTDNHLVLLNLISKNLTGKEVENALDEVGITTNKNTVPSDPQSPFVTSGIRIGLPSVTTRGMKEPEIAKIANCISEVIECIIAKKDFKHVQQEVDKLTAAFPLYPELN